MTKPVAVSDVLVDPAITNFLHQFNPTEYNDQYRSSSAIANDIVNQLSATVSTNEKDELVRKTIISIAKVADQLWTLREYRYALIEFNKISSIILSYYQLGVDIISKLRNFVDVTTRNYEESILQDYVRFLQLIYSNVLSSSNKKGVIVDKLHG